MGKKTCSKCRIRKKNMCKWVNERNMHNIGQCVTNPLWGGACATCKAKNLNTLGPGVDFGITLKKFCKDCLDRTPGVKYFPRWNTFS